MYHVCIQGIVQCDNSDVKHDTSDKLAQTSEFSTESKNLRTKIIKKLHQIENQERHIQSKLENKTNLLVLPFFPSP